VSVVIGYALLGATWLIMRTDGELQDRAFRYAGRLAIVTVALIVAVSAATPFLEHEYWKRWFEMPGVLATAQVPLLVAVGTFALFRSLAKRRERLPFLLTLGLFLLCFAGLGISIFPDIVPGAVSIAQAAAPESSLVFVLAGASFLIPIILAYTAWAYWVFRGKTGHEGYH
jgi:cytochrome d ubiquinol oxidase subunit II